MNNEYTEADYTFREELFKNPDFTKEHQVSFKNEHYTRHEFFTDRFWATLSEESFLSNDDIDTLRKMVEDSFIHLDIELDVSWRRDISSDYGKSTFTCDDEDDIRKILFQENEVFAMEVENEIWRERHSAGDAEYEYTIREATACFKFEMPFDEQKTAAYP